MPFRIRDRQFTVNSGDCYTMYAGTYFNNDHGTAVDVHHCEDVVGEPLLDHDLLIKLYEWDITPLKGSSDYGIPGYIRNYVNYPPQITRSPLAAESFLNAMPYSEKITKVLADSNPSVPTVDSVAFVAELRDIPGLFDFVSRNLIKRGANAFLSYQYGWKPLISDLKKYLDFKRVVAKRVDELERLYQKGGLKRTVQLESLTKSSTQNNISIDNTTSVSLVGDMSITSTQRSWGTARWTTDGSQKYPQTDRDMLNRAVNAAYGFSISPATAWELMPWSWMIDWATNVSDYLDANRNSVGAYCSHANVMTHTRTVRKWTVTNAPPWLSGGNGTLVSSIKERRPGNSPMLSAGMPFLSTRQMSILSALKIQRTRGIYGKFV